MPFTEKTSTRRTFVVSAAAVSAGIAAGLPSARAVLAQEATPGAEEAMGLPPLPEGALLVADGLFNPRFIAVADDGTLYITENGVGGDEMLMPPAIGTGELEATPVAGATPIAAEPEQEQEGPPATRGYSGQITQVTPDGTQSVVASGLASYSIGTGPVGIVTFNNEVYFSIGGVAVEMGIEPLEGENAVHRLDPATGTVEQIAYLGQYEVDNNPDGTDVNPNLYQMDALGDGRLIVVDAGGNTVYTVDPSTGDFELAAVVPDLTGLPNAPEDAEPRQAVPTGVVRAGGTTFIGILSEFWPEGVPSVLQLNEDGTFSAAGGTLSFNVGLAVGPDNQIYASELFGFVEGAEEPGPGRVVRVYGDGTVEPVLEGVMMPHGIAFDIAGNMYVAINTLMSGPGMPAGQVIRVDGVAAV
jgi:sugar lactone lactonase YvrE